MIPQDNVGQYYFIHPNGDTTSSYAARMLSSVSVPDPPLQFLKRIVMPRGKLTVRDNIVQYYFVRPNGYIISSYIARMLSPVSMPDPPLQSLERVVRSCNAAAECQSLIASIWSQLVLA